MRTLGNLGTTGNLRATSAPSVPVKTWSFKELDPHTSCTVLSPGSLSTHCLILESTADLNNMEATQIEVKLEVAGRWTGHNTGTELSSCVYFIPSKTPATDGDAGNSVFGEWVLNTVEKQLYQKVPLHLAPKSPISNHEKPMSWEILSPGVVTETRHTKSTTASELWYWSKVKPAFSSWLVTNPLCGLGFLTVKCQDLTSWFWQKVFFLYPTFYFSDDFIKRYISETHM